MNNTSVEKSNNLEHHHHQPTHQSQLITTLNNAYDNPQYKGLSMRERRDCTIIGKFFFF